MTPRVRSILTEFRQRLEEVYGDRLSQMVLYGSQARDEADPGSDIDVLVVLQGPVDAAKEIARTSEIVAELCLLHNAVIACVFIDEERFAQRQGPLLRNVRREGVPV